jgi:hypothetical protein
MKGFGPKEAQILYEKQSHVVIQPILVSPERPKGSDLTSGFR